MAYDEGNYLSIVGGFITLLGTYIFTIFTLDVGGTDVYVHGYAGWLNVGEMFTNTAGFASTHGMVPWVVILLAFILIWFLLSGLIQMAGKSSSAAAILGSFLPILVGLAFFLYSVNVLNSDWNNLLSIFWSDYMIIEGIFPITLQFVSQPATLGTYLLLVGGFVGLIGGV